MERLIEKGIRYEAPKGNAGGTKETQGTLVPGSEAWNEAAKKTRGLRPKKPGTGPKMPKSKDTGSEVEAPKSYSPGAGDACGQGI